jgi:hypothetical protein
MLTIEQARELLGTLPKGVEEDEREQAAFLDYWSYYLKEPYGEEWMREHSVSIIGSWRYIWSLL